MQTFHRSDKFFPLNTRGLGFMMFASPPTERTTSMKYRNAAELLPPQFHFFLVKQPRVGYRD